MKPRKDDAIRTRLEAAHKLALMRLAARRHLDLSDLVREAVSDLIAKYRPRASHA